MNKNVHPVFLALSTIGSARVGPSPHAEYAEQPASNLVLFIDKPFVVTLDQLALNLLHRIKSDADDDEQRSTAELNRTVKPARLPKNTGMIEITARKDAPKDVIRVITRVI